MKGVVEPSSVIGQALLGLTERDDFVERIHCPNALLSNRQPFPTSFSELDVANKNQELYLTWCTVKIQAWWRSTVCRRRFQHMLKAAKTIQAAWRTFPKELALAYKARKTRVPAVYLAATKRFYEITKVVRIQHLWRSLLDKRKFKSIRDLVRSFERADPKSTLLQINRSEATLVDKATGLHLRFRLCGLSFPPLVVYKVYTHRPVVDMGSFSPRDYSQRNQSADKTYIRCENNAWRPVIGTPAEQAGAKAVLQVSKPGIIFSNSPEERKALKLLDLKKRKRAWLRKLYFEGRAAECDAGKIQDDEKQRPSSPQLEDLELVRWSAGLDFDAFERDCWYMQALALPDLYDKDWHTLGTCLAD